MRIPTEVLNDIADRHIELANLFIELSDMTAYGGPVPPDPVPPDPVDPTPPGPPTGDNWIQPGGTIPWNATAGEGNQAWLASSGTYFVDVPEGYSGAREIAVSQLAAQFGYVVLVFNGAPTSPADFPNTGGRGKTPVLTGGRCTVDVTIAPTVGSPYPTCSVQLVGPQ